MKKLVLVLLASSLILTGCSKEDATTTVGTQYVPSHCEDTKILASLPDSISNPKFIDTQWEPSEGTDLYAALNAGGLACSFGIQEAEIGTTILWAPDDDALFNERSQQWTKDGQVSVDIPGVDESAAYVLTEGKEGSDEYHVWAVNFLYQGIWIHIGATFANSIEDYTPLAKAAIESLRDETKMAAENVTGCYAFTSGNDLLTMKLDQQDRNLVFAKLGYYVENKPAREGQLIGSYRNGVLTGIFESQSLDKKSQQELFFKGDKKEFLPGMGATEKKSGVELFKRPLNISWDQSTKYVPSDKCS